MVQKTLSFLNPNADALIIPQEEGSDRDDHYFGSIGDATMRHIESLCDGDRMLYEDLYTPRSGAIFRSVPSNRHFDSDPFNLKGKDLDLYLKEFEGKCSADDLIAVKEAIELEAERREKSEDIHDVSDLVPYDQWEQYPQMWNKIDIPSTPKDRYIYMGNCTQQFYDFFPDGHPDTKNINQCINMMNRDWDAPLTEDYGKFVKEVIEGWKWSRKYTLRHMLLMIDALVVEHNLDEVVIKALKDIDHCWRVEVLNSVAQKMMQDPICMLLVKKESEWDKSAKEGFSVYASIKTFGQVLFKDFRGIMNGYHWHRYRRNRDKHAPKVIIRGVDINRCVPSELQRILRLDRNSADRIWHERPFETLDEIYNKGYITGIAFSDDDKTDKVIGFIEKHSQIASKQLDTKRLDDVRKILIKQQQQNETQWQLSSEQWSMIWRYYRILKADLVRAINVRPEEGERHG